MYKHLIENHDYHICAGLLKYRDAMCRHQYVVDDCVSLRVMLFGEHDKYDFHGDKTEFYSKHNVKVEYSTFIEINKQAVTGSKFQEPVKLIYFYDIVVDMHTHINGIDYAASVKNRFDSTNGYDEYAELKAKKALDSFIDTCLKFDDDYRKFLCNHSYDTTLMQWIECEPTNLKPI